MIKSMTGYGTARGDCGDAEITVELRGVNNRFLDCSAKLPRMYLAFEDVARKAVQSRVTRGKVDVFVSVDIAKASDVEIHLNEGLAEAYYETLQMISQRFSIPCEITAERLASVPDMLSVTKKQIDLDKFGAVLTDTLTRAIDDYNAMRSIEGEKLCQDLLTHITNIETLIGEVESRSPETVREYRDRLYKKLSEMLDTSQYDESRILTETAIFADRISVDEETVRLRSHTAQFRSMLESGGAVGRKLDFLIQEMNREANTIGSKGNNVEMAKIVVDLKAELEKLREQVQNVE